jgi:phage terminase large subunit-like protein
MPDWGLTAQGFRLCAVVFSQNAEEPFFDCNPSGKSHWSHQLFVQKIEPQSKTELKFPARYACMQMNPQGNASNLPPGYVEETLAGLPERQRLRFLEGAWLDDMAGALWSRVMIEPFRVVNAPLLSRIVVGVDPAVTSRPDSDETGIVVAGLGTDNHYYVLSDASLRGTPAEWAQAVDAQYRHFRADRVVAEVNNGGDLIAANLRNVNPELSCRSITASRGKIVRAEPVAALYELGRVHHVGIFPELEDQMCNYNPLMTAFSPDRMDALVWALTELSGNSGGSRAIIA